MKTIKDMKFPAWIFQYGTKSGRTPFRIYRISSASTSAGAKVDLIAYGIYSIKFKAPFVERDKNISYARLKKMHSINDLNIKMKRNIIIGVLN